MRVYYFAPFLFTKLAGTASIGQRDGSPCAAVSQSADAILAEATGKLFIDMELVESSLDVLDSNTYSIRTISL